MSHAVPPLPPLREVIARHGLAARKSLGQHFLLDLNLTRRVAAAAGDLSAATAIEIGPGPGGLTRALLECGVGQVIAVEKDARCIAALGELGLFFEDRLAIIEADALTVDVGRLGTGPRHIVANLPYNIATRLLVNWLTALAAEPLSLKGMTLMFQKEVAQRLAAEPRSKSYGRLSILAQWLTRVELLFDVPAQAFVPRPRVTSTLVSLTPRPRPLHPARLAALERITSAAFGQRRKMLRQSLRALPVDGAALLTEAGINETARAEELSIEQFCRLAELLDQAMPGASNSKGSS